jgi:hypothetical protein
MYVLAEKLKIVKNGDGTATNGRRLRERREGQQAEEGRRAGGQEEERREQEEQQCSAQEEGGKGELQEGRGAEAAEEGPARGWAREAVEVMLAFCAQLHVALAGEGGRRSQLGSGAGKRTRDKGAAAGVRAQT